MKVKLGTGFNVDLKKLVDTRLLVQANSGGGKSYLIRKLLEETHGKVQQIVLDVEGDFSSLRERYDFILAGKGGDLSAEPEHAELLCRKVLELNADLIVDLYELRQPERIRFVRKFLEALINAPKTLWHPALVIIDEAHLFAPEKGKAESLSAVIDICTRGRKRGYCAVLATQRLSKLHKDAAAECNNKLIGRTGLDIDVKRAMDELGMSNSRESLQALRTMSPGEFHAFGPAISDTVEKVQVGEVQTTHPKAGQRGLGAKPTISSAKLKKALAELADLPREAEEEANDNESLRLKVRELERELAKKPQPKMEQEEIDKIVAKVRIEIQKQADKNLAEIRAKIRQWVDDLPMGIALEAPKITPRVHSAPPPVRHVTPKPRAQDQGDQSLGQCERRILGFLGARPEQWFNKVQVGALSGYRPGSGGFNNALSKLGTQGLIERRSGQMKITDDALSRLDELVGNDTPHRLEDWITKLGACERKIYETCLADPSHEWEKSEIAEATGYQAGSGGFNNALSRLKTLGLIERPHGGHIKLNSEIVGV